MYLKSFAEIEKKLQPIEVELLLLPGLPQLHFLGLPDQGIKEIDRKIRSAFRRQGFEFPKSQQVVINLRPNHLKKSSKGLDLAVALALLMETGQLPKLLSSKNFYVYGQLNLEGHVDTPDDTTHLPLDDKDLVLTGEGENVFPFQSQVVRELKDLLKAPNFRLPCKKPIQTLRPIFGLEQDFTEEEVKWMQLLVIGRHSCLIAGPPGGGKTTFAHALSSFLIPPEDKAWHPTIAPHHSNTITSLIGGGSPLKGGDVTRAHNGILILDEFLEFDPKIQEALREPVEEGVLRLSRKNETISFNCAFQFLATTNLCPCGRWLPGHIVECGRSRQRCYSNRQRLSGPLLDRFDTIYFKKKPEGATISGQELLGKMEALQREIVHRNFFQELPEIPQWIKEKLTSRRRELATRRVAKTLALMEGRESMSKSHWESALDFTHWPFISIQKDLN